MRQTIWSEAAVQQLREADLHYRPLSDNFADRLAERVLAAVAFIASNPLAGPEVRGGIRKWSVRGIDHVILYRVRPESIRVLHVLHAARDWQRFL